MRPMGDTRFALVAAMHAGAVGTFDVLAAHAGVAPAQAQYTLCSLLREGRVTVQGTAQARPTRGRPRLVYQLANSPATHRHFELDRTLSNAWR